MTPSEMIASGCQAGHVHHATVRVNVHLRGQPRPYDYPPIPERLAQSFPFEVYDVPKYDNFRGYCPGQDETSRALVTNGTWEGFETLLALDILSNATGVVLDFGAHIGWFSVLAARAGFRVRAFEAEPEHARVLRINAKLNNVADRIRLELGFAAPDTGILAPTEVAFLKCDVEGQEDRIVAKCRRLFKGRHIRAAMLEVSPCFARHYAETCGFIADCGYDVFDIPDKGEVNLAAYSADPLGVTRTRVVQREDIGARIAAMHQRNWLFLRRDA